MHIVCGGEPQPETPRGMGPIRGHTPGSSPPGPRQLAPEVLEPIRRQLGVPHRVLDVLMPEVGLQRTSIATGIRQGVAAAVAQHVRVNGERHLRHQKDTSPRERPFVPNAEGRSFLFGRLGVGAPCERQARPPGRPIGGRRVEQPLARRPSQSPRRNALRERRRQVVCPLRSGPP
jgi:hypothetical protein